MGDFNINTMYEMSCTLTQEQEFINLFSTLHYHKLINLPTRITQQSSSLLDNIYTTLPYHNSSKGVLISDHSDHYIVFTIQHGTTSTKAPTHREMRDFSEQNISKFKKKIKNTIWDKFYAIPLAQDAYSVFANHINNYFKKCFPNKNVKINYRNKITWIGAELKRLPKRINYWLFPSAILLKETRELTRVLEILSSLNYVRLNPSSMMTN